MGRDGAQSQPLHPLGHGSVVFSRFWCEEEGKDQAAMWWPLSTLLAPTCPWGWLQWQPLLSSHTPLHFTTCPVVQNHHGPLTGLCTAPDWRTCV